VKAPTRPVGPSFLFKNRIAKIDQIVCQWPQQHAKSPLRPARFGLPALHSLTTRFTVASIEGEKRKLLRCGMPAGDRDNRSIRWTIPRKTAAPQRLSA
jgi:hypothetical protein